MFQYLRSRISRAGFFAVAMVVLVGMPAAAVAFDKTVTRQVHHFIECWKYMLTDEPAHIAHCSPSNQAPFSRLPQTGGQGVARILPPPMSSEVPDPSSSEEPLPSSSEEPPPSSSEEPSEEPEEPSCDPEIFTEQCPPPS